MLLIVAIIHLLPVSGFISTERLSALYGFSIEGPNLEILMRHRAVLFGLLGAFFVYAAFNTAVQPLAFIAAFLSISSFFYLAWAVGDYNSAIATVVKADIIAALSLVVAVVLYYKQ